MRRVDLIQYRQRWKDDPELKCLGSARDDLLEMADALEAAWDRAVLTDNNLNSALSANRGLQGKLDAAWRRIDEVERQNLDVTVEIQAMRHQAYEAEKKCIVLLTSTTPSTVALSEFCAAIESAWTRIDEMEQQNRDLTVERDALLRGEYICRKCGLRKDGETHHGGW